jgi:hypothetical protein
MELDIYEIDLLLNGIFAIFVALSAFKDKTDRVFAYLAGWIFVTSILLKTLGWIPRDKKTDHALSITVFWLSDLIAFSWYFGHYLAWRIYQGFARIYKFEIVFGAACIILLLGGAIIYRFEQFSPAGEYLGSVERSGRWWILHSTVAITVFAALFHLIRFVLNNRIETAHLILMLSTFCSIVQIIFTMKVGVVMDLGLYYYGLMVFFIIGILIYGFRIIDQNNLYSSLRTRCRRRFPDK